MNPYILPPEPDIGERARRLRCQLALTTAQVAERAGVSEQEVIEFEHTSNGTVQAMLAIHDAISNTGDVAQLFTIPKFQTLDEVIAFERRRRGKEEGEGA